MAENSVVEENPVRLSINVVLREEVDGRDYIDLVAVAAVTDDSDKHEFTVRGMKLGKSIEVSPQSNAIEKRKVVAELLVDLARGIATEPRDILGLERLSNVTAKEIAKAYGGGSLVQAIRGWPIICVPYTESREF